MDHELQRVVPQDFLREWVTGETTVHELTRIMQAAAPTLQATAPRTDYDQIPVGDTHVWIELNGIPFDPTPPPKIAWFKTDGDVHLIPFPPETQVRLYKEFLRDNEALARHLNNPMYVKQLVRNPQPNCCWSNALAYKKLYPKVKVVIGSQGFVQCDNSVHYEFG